MDFTQLQGSVSTQLRCVGIFSNHFITNFPQNVPVKICKSVKEACLVKMWTRICGFLFWTDL